MRYLQHVSGRRVVNSNRRWSAQKPVNSACSALLSLKACVIGSSSE